MHVGSQTAFSLKAALLASARSVRSGFFKSPAFPQIYSASSPLERALTEAENILNPFISTEYFTLEQAAHLTYSAESSNLSETHMPLLAGETLNAHIAGEILAGKALSPHLAKEAKASQIAGIALNSKIARETPNTPPNAGLTSAFPSSVNEFKAFTMSSQQQEVIIALGSNMGNRVASFEKALGMMKRAGVDVISHASLYESAPAYVLDQPKFLNSAVRASTRLDPNALLGVLKGIERSLGRATNGIRYGPRPIDLDILFYGDVNLSDENLTVPHPLIWERPFVLAPLMDLYSPKLAINGNQLWTKRFERAKCAWQLMGGDKQLGQDGLKRVIPVGSKLWHWSDRTYLMGILNVTPDSFSDGGKYFSVQDAVAQADALARAGADIIDLGAQSTRPFATKLTSDEELARLIPVLEAIKKLPSMESVWLSVDTFYSKVAREAVNHGVHMVNDVSGGSLDPDMYTVVAELGVPYVLMHMRGDPTTMQEEKNLQYKNVSADVAEELCERLKMAESMGIPAWRIVVDPGLGFSKTTEQNVQLLGDLSAFRSGLGAWSLTATNLPMLIGPSRKRFLGKICNREKAEDRDAATIGAVVAGVSQGADIVRLHNVEASMDAIRVADAIFKSTGLAKGFRQV